MNREETKKAIEVMQAYVDGEKVQVKVMHNSGWQGYGKGAPMWNWEKVDYRIKPKPREVWINSYSDRLRVDVFDTEDWAKHNCGRLGKTTKFLEVLEDE